LKWRHILMRYLSGNIFNLLIFGTTILLSESYAQRANSQDDLYWSTEENIGGPIFRLSTYQRITDSIDDVGLDVYIKIAHDMLQFVRSDNLFEASLELNLSIIDEHDKLVERKVVYLHHSVKSFDLTNSRKNFMISTISTELTPGEYRLTVSLSDQESKRQFTKKTIVVLKGSDDPFNISDIILANSTELILGQNAPLNPLVNGRLFDQDASLFCFMDLFRLDPLTETDIKYSVFNAGGKEVFRDSTTIIGGEKLSSFFLPVDCTEMTIGKYKLMVKVSQLNQTVECDTEFKINYNGLPTSIEDVDLAIRQLSIVADKKDINRLSKYPIHEKEEELVNYWDINFPSPDEAVNGKMIEYYLRVSNANIQFGNGSGGWKTDRGRVLVKYGNPTNIERQSVVDNSVPYEIWNYSHLSKRFIFRDDHGFGDYRLVSQLW